MSISNRMYDRLSKLYRLVLVRMRNMEAARMLPLSSPLSRLRLSAALNPSANHGLEPLEPRTLLSASPFEPSASPNPTAIYVSDTPTQNMDGASQYGQGQYDQAQKIIGAQTWNPSQSHRQPQLERSTQRGNPSVHQTSFATSTGFLQQKSWAYDTQSPFSFASGTAGQNGPPVIEAGTVPGIPELSSRPGAAYTLYLDFGGFAFTGNWEDYTPGVTPAYDFNGDPTSFTAAEKANIKEIWSRVAEKYAIFDINVTTVDPAIAAGQAASDLARQTYYDSQPQMMHTVIGGTDVWLPNSGGVSYVDVASGTQSWLNGGHTNWVFSGESPTNLKFVAEATAHENGHALGLYHQANYSGNTLKSSYSSGTSLFAPLMGNSYSAQRGLWSVGTANNNTGSPVLQNDIDLLISNPNLGGFIDDGIGHYMAAATPIPLLDSDIDFITATGTIRPNSESNPTPLGAENYTSDWWIFATEGGQITLSSVSGRSTINPGYADPGATLHTALSIYDYEGTLISNLQSSSLSQTYTGFLEAGTYYAQIQPVADIVDNNPSYTTRSFFDVGSYFLKGTGFSELVTTPPTSYDFDFGTLSSPVLAGSIAVNETISYNADLGYGWQTAGVLGRDRGVTAGSNAQTQDLNFTADGTFAVDLANDAYTVTVILGDTADYLHDQMGVYLEGNFQESVNTAKGQVVSKTYSVTVTDGQLNLRLKNLGGVDDNVTIQGLTIVSEGAPVNQAPTVVDINKTLDQGGTQTFTASDFTAAFSDLDAGDTLQTIKITSMPGNGVVKLDGSFVALNQEIALYQIANLTYTPNSSFAGDDSFEWAGSDGKQYSETSALVNLTVIASPGAPSNFDFDFGTRSSPLLSGAARVSEANAYNPNIGYGWQTGGVQSRDRGATAGTNEQTQDLNFTTDGTFAVDLANGAYTVTVILGDSADYLHDQMGVYLENTFQESVNTAKGQVVTRTYNVTVNDGQLNLRLRDLGGIDGNVTIQGLTITSDSPAANEAPTLDDINKSLNQGGTLTFTASDFTQAFNDVNPGDTLQMVRIINLPANGVLKLNGADVAVNQEIAFNQLANLTYMPNSGFIGEDTFEWNASDGQLYADSSSLVYLAVSEVTAVDLDFDFGTTTSPLLAGATRVSEATSYSAGLGYGWQTGSVLSRDRGVTAGTTAQTQDLNFTDDATFAVNLANGSYDVTVILGDSANYLHDQMGVYLEGAYKESVSTAKGQVVTRTYNVTVADGQLTLRLRDLGGVDANVTIQGLKITTAV